MSLLATCIKLPGIDMGRVTQMAIVHDLAEVAVGDLTPHDQVPKHEKLRRERETMELFASMLGNETGQFLLDLWLEFEGKETRESKVANDFDKVDMILQARVYEETHGKRLPEFMRAVKRIDEPILRDWLLTLPGVTVDDGEGIGPEGKAIDEYYK